MKQKSTKAPTCSEASFSSKEALRKATNRAKKSMPKSSEKYADVLSQLVGKATPRSKEKLNKKCIVSPKSKKHLDFLQTSASALKNTMENLNPRRNTKDLQRKRSIAVAVAVKKKYSVQECKHVGISYNLLHQAAYAPDITEQAARKRRSDALKEG